MLIMILTIKMEKRMLKWKNTNPEMFDLDYKNHVIEFPSHLDMMECLVFWKKQKVKMHNMTEFFKKSLKNSLYTYNKL